MLREDLDHCLCHWLPAGPPDVSWLGSVGTLELQPDNSWRIKMPDGSTQLYVDPGGVVPSLRNWLPKQQQLGRYDPEFSQLSLLDPYMHLYVETRSSLGPPSPTTIFGTVKVCGPYAAV